MNYELFIIIEHLNKGSDMVLMLMLRDCDVVCLLPHVYCSFSLTVFKFLTLVLFYDIFVEGTEVMLCCVSFIFYCSMKQLIVVFLILNVKHIFVSVYYNLRVLNEKVCLVRD